MNVNLLCPQGHPVVVAAGKAGDTAICPHCLTAFRIELDFEFASHARKPERRSRDDDDDDEDDEEERPRKKKSKADDEAIEADDKPRRPRKPKPRDDDDEAIESDDKPRRPRKPQPRDDEDDDDEDRDEDDKPRRKKGRVEDDDEDEESTPAGPANDEEPIKWTTRKRQLSVVSNALVLYQINFWIMFTIFALDGLNIIASLIGIFVPLLAMITFILTAFVLLPAVGASFLVQLAAWIMMFWAPGRSGARGSAITAIGFFFAPVLLFAIHLILSFSSFFRNDIVESRFLFLMIALSCLSGLISFFFSVQVLGNIAGFMGLLQLAKEPVTLGWFIIGGALLRLIISAGILFMVYAGFAMTGVAGLALYAPLLLVLGMDWFVVRAIIDLVGVTNKLRAHIAHYIKEG